jgi:crotonobetainyl-CoA:carnitine CoA-transferase CaiB-like acyl-CoA transferase
VIAGPVATRDLAVAGADVLRIDSPRLPEPVWQHFDTGHEKRSALLDFADPANSDRLEMLLADADVVVQGYRPGALARFGLDVESLHRRFPGIVVARLSAWGAEGPWGQRRGFDSLVQAASGIAVLESGDGGATPGALPVQALDHSAGHFLAASIATALRRQRSLGGSFEIGISLAHIANELTASGPSNGAAPAGSAQQLPTTQVPVTPGNGTPPATVTCAPPVLGFPGAPTSYPSPLHAWGSDQAGWVD